MKVTLMAFSLLFLLTASRSADACSCVGRPTTCQAYAKADAILIGVVTKVEQIKARGDDPPNEDPGGQIAQIRGETVFKGVIGTEATFRAGGTTCDFSFEVGERWLFYAYYNNEKNVWSAGGICGRSRPIEHAGDDLLFLQGLPASAQRSRISGILTSYRDDPEKGMTGVPIVGTRVKIIGKEQTHEVFTDKNGVYEIYGLSPGEYVIRPDTPPGLKTGMPLPIGDTGGSSNDTADERAKIKLEERSCEEMNFPFHLDADTSISGKVLSTDGRPLRNVCLSLQPKGKHVSETWRFDCTDEHGDYKLETIPPGEYIIVVNYKNRISGDAPFPRAYYPGVFDQEKAAVIQLTGRGKLENYDINVPSQEPTNIVQGTLLYADGRPVVDGFVEFKADKVKEGWVDKVHIATDAQGHFSLNVLKGLEGRLYGYMFAYVGKYANCPALDKLIEAKGGLVPQVETEPLRLKIDTDLQGLKLIFPFGFCEKSQ